MIKKLFKMVVNVEKLIKMVENCDFLKYCSEQKFAAPQRTRTHVRKFRVWRVIFEQRRAAY